MYNGLEATLHDAFWEAEEAEAELELLEKFLAAHPGTALELGCGSGRLLLPLLEMGYLVEGLDNSADMLDLCRKNSGAHEPVLHRCSIQGFETGAVYAAVAVPAFTLQLLDYAEIPEVLANIRRHLHPGGGLYITTFIPWAEITGELEEREEYPDHETYFPDGRSARCFTRFRIKRASQQLVREHRYELLSADGKLLDQGTSTHRLTWFWPREMEKLLADAGFSVVSTRGDFHADSPMDEDSQIITVTARRADAD